MLCDSTVVVRTRPRAINMRKSIHGFLFPYMVMGVRLAGAAGTPLKKKQQLKFQELILYRY